MSPVIFRKTLLALAITTTALPVSAETLTLTNAGLVRENKTYQGNLEIKGAYTGSAAEDAIEFNGNHVKGDLILNATINSSGNFAGGIDMDAWEGSTPWTESQIDGNLINKGSITAVGGGANALMIDPATINGSVINQGLLSATGEPLRDNGETDVARALDFTGTIKGNLINDTQGRIIAEGTRAKGINLEGGRIDGRVINRGLIQVNGKGATAIDATTSGEGLNADKVDLTGILNSGTIIASGDDAEGIRVDGASFSGTDNHVVNTGTIKATDAAIVIGNFDIDAAQSNAQTPLRIINSGTLISQDEAVDASESQGPVYLTLQNGSKVTGNLIDLNYIEVYGNVNFSGTDSKADGANIRLRDGGRMYVGNSFTNSPAHLNFEQPHTTIKGSLIVADNASLGLNLRSATNPDTPVLKVSGTAAFSKNAQIKLTAKGSDFSAQGSKYNLIQAGTLSVMNADGTQVDPKGKINLVSSSALLKIDGYNVSGNKLVATVTGKGEAEVNQILVGQGASANSQQAMGSLNRDTILSKLNANDPLLLAFANADEAQLAKLAEQLTPEVNGGATQAATTSQNLVSNVTGSRTSGLRGASSGEAFKDTGVWVQSLYSDASQDLRDGVAGYNAYSRGIAVGADGKVSDDLTLGLAYSFINTDVNGKSGNQTEVDSHAFTLYGGFEHGNYFVDASLTYGFNENDSKRSIASTSAKADYDSDLLGLNLVGGYTYHINPQVLVEPRIAARYSLVNIDGYREKGSSAALKVDDQRYEAIELGAGLRVAGNYPLGAGTLKPQAKLMAYHDFAADEAKSTSTFLLGNTPFVTSGAKAVRDSYEAGVGADYTLGAVTLGVNYDYIGKSGFDADVFSAKVRYDF